LNQRNIGASLQQVPANKRYVASKMLGYNRPYSSRNFTHGLGVISVADRNKREKERTEDGCLKSRFDLFTRNQARL